MSNTQRIDVRIRAKRLLQRAQPDLYSTPGVEPGFEWCCENAPARRLRYLGYTGGDHVLRDSAGRCWRVDLVTETVALCVGLLPEQWEHPPIP